MSIFSRWRTQWTADAIRRGLPTATAAKLQDQYQVLSEHREKAGTDQQRADILALQREITAELQFRGITIRR